MELLTSSAEITCSTPTTRSSRVFSNTSTVEKYCGRAFFSTAIAINPETRMQPRIIHFRRRSARNSSVSSSPSGSGGGG